MIRAYDPPHLLEYTWGDEIQRWELDPDRRRLPADADRHVRRPPRLGQLHRRLDLCLDALDQILGGDGIPREHYALLHEHFVKTYGLDQGQVLDDGSIHFERQLTAPKEQVWQTLTQPIFVANGIERGRLLKSDEPVELSYEWQHGTITWHLRDGNGGARLELTRTGPAKQYLDPWHDLIEDLATNLATATATS